MTSNLFVLRIYYIAVFILLSLLGPLLCIAIFATSALIVDLLGMGPSVPPHFTLEDLPGLLLLNLFCIALFYIIHLLTKRISRSAVVMFFFAFALVLPVVFLLGIMELHAPTTGLALLCVLLFMVVLLSLYVWKNSTEFKSRFFSIALFTLLSLLAPLLCLTLFLSAAFFADILGMNPFKFPERVIVSSLFSLLFLLNLLCMTLFYIIHLLARPMSRKAVIGFFLAFSLVLSLLFVFLGSALDSTPPRLLLLGIALSTVCMLFLYVKHITRVLPSTLPPSHLKD